VDLNIDYIYFSFVTLTTVGYGDLTAAQSMGKMMAVSEALLGQLYLVGVVALLASNLGASFQGRLGRPPTEKDPADSGKSDAENRVS
jgi:voltage-gated potassium channel Kch